MKRLHLFLLCCVLMLLGRSALAASTYTFRSDNYAWETTNTAITWDRTCTGYQGDDDKATITFSGGFRFTFAGTAYTSVRVLANGGLQFGSDTGFYRTFTNTALPAAAAGALSGCTSAATTNVILAYWTDLNPSQAGSGGVTWQQKGTSPNRYVVVSWNGVYQYSTTTPYTFQIILYESASGVNGEFKFQYGNDNASGSNATIGVQVSSSDFTQYSYNSGYNANGSAIRWFVPSGTPTRRAEYRFDEWAYSGKIGEVADSSGNSNNGVRIGSATTVPGGYVCRGLSLPADASNASNAVDTLLDVNSAIGDKGAVTFWYAANTAWNNGAALLLDATTAANRPFFLVRQADGSLRATITDSNGVVLSAVTPVQNVTAGTWRHVAVSWRLATGTGQSSLRIFVSGLQAGAVSGTTSGTLDNSIGTLFVGDNRSTALPTNSTYNAANGTIDEMRVYNYDISALELTADMAPSHACLPPLDHYEVWLPSTSLTCSPTTLTIRACSTSASTCSVETSINGTAQLSSNAGTVTPTTVNFVNGVATATLSQPGGADGSTATLTLSGESVSAPNARRCCPDGANCTAANTCSTTFNRAAFIVSASAGGAAAVIPTQTAGTTSSTYFLRAVRSNSTTQACEAALTGANSVNWAYQCVNPLTCSGSNLMTITGSAATTIQRNDTVTSPLSYTSVPMVFDANGNAPFTLNFADAGQTTLQFNRTVNADVITGSSNAFVTRPAGFTVTNITRAVSPFAANPAATSAAGGMFVPTDTAFAARITATTANGAAAPNFGKESPAEGVLLKPSLVLPSPGNNGSLAGNTVTGGQFSSGVANVSNLGYSEVGIIRLTASVADADYLGTGDVNGTASANIGRFVPAGFVVTAQSPVQRSDFTCGTASTFTYLDENFQLRFGLQAVNTAKVPTQNYTGAFAKLDLTAASSLNLAGVAGSTLFKTTDRLSISASNGTWANGAASVTLTAKVARATPADGPFDTARFGVAPVDSDLVRLMTPDLDTDPATAGLETALVGQIPLRHGRLRLQNAISAVNRPLRLPLVAQHWDSVSATYKTNDLDSCTRITSASLSFGNLRKTLTAADLVMSPATVTVNPTSPQFITLAAPGGGRLGSVDVAIALGSGSIPGDASCLKSVSNWTPTVGASSGANLAALRGAWCGNTSTSDPSARATWGLYRGSDGVVYQRENF